MTKKRYEILLQQFKSDRLSQAEYEELMGAIDVGIFDGYVQEDILASLRLRRTDPMWTSERENAVWDQINPVKTNDLNEHILVPVVHIRRRLFSRISAAVAIFILFSAGIYLRMKNHSLRHSLQTEIAKTNLKNDVTPGYSGAILTLSNGQKIVLDSAGNGVLTRDANVQVIKKDGEIVYQGKTNEIVYNDIATDKGRQWQLTLSDGTKVWLNAASSIHFPLTFTESERVVEITGEAYFEVAENAHQPFKVKVADQIIQDIGTHFNINAYPDEPFVTTTLIEGSVKVTHGSSSVIIKPGEQASLASGSNKILVSSADVEAAIAWKNGVFELTNANIASIMRQISRWYDVEITYKGDVPKGTISGEVPRNLNLSEVLKVMALCRIHCELEGRKLTVFD